MKFTNSPLVNYTKLSPNHSGQRNHVIDTITIHCVVGQLSVETLGNVFAPTSRKASSNYGIGADGRIGMYVEEKNRSWCSSSASNDNRAITIEVASDTSHPYAVNDKAYAALLDLLTDICKRNNIKQLLWKGDKSLIGKVDKQNMTVHRWFANKSCPGEYLYSRHGAIADEVNKRLNAGTTPTKPAEPSKPSSDDFLVRVTADVLNIRKGAGTNYPINGVIKDKGTYTIVETNGDWGKLKSGMGWIHLGYTQRLNGENTAPPSVAPKVIKVGSKVKVKPGAKTYTGGGVADFVYKNVYTVDQLNGNRAVLDSKGICTPFKISDLILQ
jgi:hypothetical protein